ACLFAHTAEQFQSWRTERELVNLPLLGVAARFDPEPRFVFDLAPCRRHSFSGPTAGQHDEADAVGGGYSGYAGDRMIALCTAVLVQGVRYGSDLRLAEEPLPTFL